MIVHRTRLRLPALLVAVAALTSCHDGDPTDLAQARRLYTDTDSMGVRVHDRTIAIHARPELLENSGVAMSTKQPGVIFTINDSGNDPMLFALDTTGADRGAWRLQGATNVDWEAISMGPCENNTRDSATVRGSCIYIGDVGDNRAVRKSATIYRVREPIADSAATTSTIPAESLSFTYEDQPHDVESMYVAADGSVHLITKRPLRTPVLQRRRPSLVFTIPSSAWRDRSTVAHVADSLSIVPGSAPNRVITDASLSRDGRLLAVRTYWQVYLFATDSSTGRITAFEPRGVCNVAGIRERQGEGISWYLDSRQLLLSSEGAGQPLRIIDCPAGH